MTRERLVRRGNTLIDSICAEFFETGYEGWSLPELRIEREKDDFISFYLTETEDVDEYGYPEEIERTRENYIILDVLGLFDENNICPLDYPYCIESSFEWRYDELAEQEARRLFIEEGILCPSKLNIENVRDDIQNNIEEVYSTSLKYNKEEVLKEIREGRF